MERKILSSFIVINLVLCLLAGFPVQAQNSNRPPASNPPKEQKKEVDEEAFPLYNGVSVSVDLWGIGSKAFGSVPFHKCLLLLFEYIWSQVDDGYMICL